MKKLLRHKWVRMLWSWAKVLTFSLIFAFVVLEIAFRFMGFGSMILYEPHPSLYWAPKPDQDAKTKIGGFPIHVNGHGTRGPEFEVPKPEGVFRILSLGDSRAFGWGLPEDKTYAQRLEKGLNERLPKDADFRVEVINAGVNAWSYPQFKIYMEEVGMGFDPDLVILGDANLWMHFNENRGEEFRKAFKRRVILKNLLRRSATYHYVMESKFESFYQKHRGKMMPKVEREDEQQARTAEVDPTEVYTAYVAHINQLARDGGAACVMLHIPSAHDLAADGKGEHPFGHRNICDIKREVAAATGGAFADITPLFKEGGDALYLETDPVHPNEAGAAIIADELVKVIAPLLPDSTGTE